VVPSGRGLISATNALKFIPSLTGGANSRCPKAAPSGSRKMSYGWTSFVLAKVHRDFLLYSLRLSWTDFCAPPKIFLWKSPDGQEKI
jgi:hypothetical protein